jgi:antibiotic biosynthesis monooxygenase (ABM) superfamily enzyme
MVTYLIHYTVQYAAHDLFIEWLKTEHIPEILSLPGFMKAELCLRKGGSMTSSSKEVGIICYINDEDSLKTYISDHAMKVREKGLEKFPGQYSTQRDVWLETYTFERQP